MGYRNQYDMLRPIRCKYRSLILSLYQTNCYLHRRLLLSYNDHRIVIVIMIIDIIMIIDYLLFLSINDRFLFCRTFSFLMAATSLPLAIKRQAYIPHLLPPQIERMLAIITTFIYQLPSMKTIPTIPTMSSTITTIATKTITHL